MSFITTAPVIAGPLKEGRHTRQQPCERFIDEPVPAHAVAKQPTYRYIMFDDGAAEKFEAWPYFVSTRLVA